MIGPSLEHSIATAGAGQALALSAQGKWSGEQEMATIDFGVSRPAREMTLSEPIDIGGLRVSKFLVRDSSRLTSVGELDSQAENIDPNEVVLPTVVVTAQTSGSKPTLRITLGRDALQECASVTFDKASSQIELACLQAAQ